MAPVWSESTPAGWGSRLGFFGQAFEIGPAAVTAYAVLFFTMQIAGCVWWVKRFRFGPAEWLWRTATYLSVQRMRLER